MNKKILSFDEGDVIICGRNSDAYFATLEHVAFRDEALFRAVQGKAERYKTLFDVGANLGVTGAIMQMLLPAAEIHAFEPGKETAELLRATAAANGGSIKVHDYGLGAATGILRFNETSTLAGSHLVTEDTAASDAGNTTVQIRTMDEVVEELGLTTLDFIKIDVEGAESDVLDGATRTIARFRPEALIEFNSFCLIAFRNQNPRDFLAKVRAIYPKVSYWADGAWKPIVSGFDEHVFIHDNLVKHGCVNDLLCQFD